MGWIWRIGTLGFLNERNVLIFQGVLGVISVLLLYQLLIQILKKTPSLVISIIYSSLPIVLFTERSFLSEEVSVVIVLASLLTALNAISKSNPKSAENWLWVSLFCFGLLSIIRTVFQLFSLIAAFVVLIIFIKNSEAESFCNRIKKTGLTVVVAVLLASTAPLAMLIYNKNHYGVASINPGSGAVFAARYGPLLECHNFENKTSVAERAILQACSQQFTSVPGSTLSILWYGSLNEALSVRPQFSENIKGISDAAKEALLSHPIQVIQQIGKGTVFQLFDSPVNSLPMYWTGNGWPKNLTGIAEIPKNWFSREVEKPLRAIPLGGAVQSTIRLPQWILYCAGILGIYNLTRRRMKHSKSFLDQNQTRVLIGLLSGALISSSIFIIAATGLPGFRYWTPLIPDEILVLALAMPNSMSAEM